MIQDMQARNLPAKEDCTLVTGDCLIYLST